MRKRFMLFLLLFGFALCSNTNAQIYMHVESASGTIDDYVINNVQVITFTATDMNVKNTSGTTDAYLMDSITKIYFDDLLVSINEFDSPVINIYPNPASDMINLSIGNVDANDINIDVYNALGSLVYSKTYSSHGSEFSGSIDISKLGKGNFTVRVTNGQNAFVQKIIVQ